MTLLLYCSWFLLFSFVILYDLLSDGTDSMQDIYWFAYICIAFEDAIIKSCSWDSLSLFSSATYFSLFQTMTLISIGICRGLSHVFSDLALEVFCLVDIGRTVKNEQVDIKFSAHDAFLEHPSSGSLKAK